MELKKALNLKILKIIIYKLFKIIKNVNSSDLQNIFLNQIKKNEGNFEHFFSIRLRNRFPSSVNDNFLLSGNCQKEDFCILLQGPVLEENDFTLETVRFYKQLYPFCKIIISTWNNTKKEILKKFAELDCVVVLNEYPEYPGKSNINYQIVSTQGGILAAEKLGIKYVCKTRTDQRIYHPDVFYYFMSLIEMYPVNNSDFKIPQNSRFIVLQTEYGNLFFPYMVSDFLYFGTTCDIKDLFEIPLSNEQKGSVLAGQTRQMIVESGIAPEAVIIRNYINKHGGCFDYTIKNWWNFVKNHLISLNQDEIGLYWPKYDNRFIENQRNGYFFPFSKKELNMEYGFDFINWHNLYCSKIEYREVFEYKRDLKWN